MNGKKVRRLAGYGIGDFGLNIYWNSLSLLLVFWYVGIVGLDPKLAGWIYALGLMWDAISDPVVASIAASNRSKRGVYRPYILFGSFLLGAAFCLLFWSPPFEGWLLFAVLLLATIAFRTAYTIVAVPYSALSARLTFNSVERAELSGVRMFFAFCGLLCVTMFFFPLAGKLEAASYSSGNAFFITAALGAALATIALLACYFLTTEEAPLGGEELPVGWNPGSFFRAFAKNDALRFLLVVLLLNSAAGMSINIPLAFYVEANEGAFASKEFVMTGYALATLAGTPVWTIAVRLSGKKLCWYLATAITVIAGFSLAVIGPFLTMGVPIQIILFGFANAAFAIIVWALIPDTVEYGQYNYGKRDEGAVFGASLFTQKASGGLTGLVFGYLLSSIGYDPSQDAQTEQTAGLLENFIALAPSILLIAASIVLFHMPLSRKLHARMVNELSQ